MTEPPLLPSRIVAQSPGPAYARAAMTEHSTPLLLASGSPRRRALLSTLGLAFEIVVPETTETLRAGEGPAETVVRLAIEKAESGSRRRPDAVILAADTLVFLGDRALGKPRDPTDARRMLEALSGRTHRVWTGVAGLRPGRPLESRAAMAEVAFRRLSDREIAVYVETGEPLDKAGAYAIQGRAAAFVQELTGELSTVIGLPMSVTRELLQALGALAS
jgi:septum formation protein